MTDGPQSTKLRPATVQSFTDMKLSEDANRRGFAADQDALVVKLHKQKYIDTERVHTDGHGAHTYALLDPEAHDNIVTNCRDVNDLEVPSRGQPLRVPMPCEPPYLPETVRISAHGNVRFILRTIGGEFIQFLTCAMVLPDSPLTIIGMQRGEISVDAAGTPEFVRFPVPAGTRGDPLTVPVFVFNGLVYMKCYKSMFD